jgi:hypothetical protein
MISEEAHLTDLQKNQLFAAFLRIKQTINTIPYDDLVAIAAETIDGGNASPAVLHEKAFIAINTLAQKAGLGDESAIKCLLALGTHVTEVMRSLIGEPDDAIGSRINDPTKFPENAHRILNDADPSLNKSSFKNDMTALEQCPQIELASLFAKPPDEQLVERDIALESLTEYLSQREADPTYRIRSKDHKLHPISSLEDLLFICEFTPLVPPLVPIMHPSALHEATKYEAPERYLFPEDAPAPPDSFDTIPVLGCTTLQTHRITESAHKMSSQSLVYKIIQRLVTRRIAHVSRRIVRRIAETSRAWPIKAIAITDGRAESMDLYVKSLNLGHSIPVRFSLQDGSTRIRGEASRLGFYFTSEIIERISIARDSRLPESLPKDFWDFAESKDNQQLWKEINEFIWSPESPKETLWIRLATFLPELSQDPKVIQKWHEAAMAWAETQCGGSWESYSRLKCVTLRHDRSAEKGETRYHKSIISAILMQGIELLTKSPKVRSPEKPVAQVSIIRMKHSTEQISEKLKEAAAMHANGSSIKNICKDLGVSPDTYRRWKRNNEINGDNHID